MGSSFERRNCSADDRLAVAESLDESHAPGRQLMYLNLHSAADDQGVFAPYIEIDRRGLGVVDVHAPDCDRRKWRLRHPERRMELEPGFGEAALVDDGQVLSGERESIGCMICFDPGPLDPCDVG